MKRIVLDTKKVPSILRRRREPEESEPYNPSSP